MLAVSFQKGICQLNKNMMNILNKIAGEFLHTEAIVNKITFKLI